MFSVMPKDCWVHVLRFIEKTKLILCVLSVNKEVREGCIKIFNFHFVQLRLERIHFMQEEETIVEYVKKLEIDICPSDGDKLLKLPQDMTHRDRWGVSYDGVWNPRVHFPNVDEIKFLHDFRCIHSVLVGRRMTLSSKNLEGGMVKESKLTHLHAYGIEFVVVRPLPNLESLSLIECNVTFWPPYTENENEKMKPCECFPSLTSFTLCGLYLGPIPSNKTLIEQFRGLQPSPVIVDEYDLLFFRDSIPFHQLKKLELENISGEIPRRRNENYIEEEVELHDIFSEFLIPENVKYEPIPEPTLKILLFPEEKKMLFKTLEILKLENVDVAEELFFQEFTFPMLQELTIISSEALLIGNWKPFKELKSLHVVGGVPVSDVKEDDENPGFGYRSTEFGYHSINSTTFPKLQNLKLCGSYWDHLIGKFGLDFGVNDQSLKGLTERRYDSNDLTTSADLDNDDKCSEWILLKERAESVILRQCDEYGYSRMKEDVWMQMMKWDHLAQWISFPCEVNFSEKYGDFLSSKLLVPVEVPFQILALLMNELYLENVILITSSSWNKNVTEEKSDREKFDFINNTSNKSSNLEFRNLEYLVLKDVYFSVDPRCNEESGEEYDCLCFLENLEFGSNWSDMNNLKTLKIIYDRPEKLFIPREEMEEIGVLRPHLSEGFLSSRKFPRLQKLLLRNWPLSRNKFQKKSNKSGLFDNISHFIQEIILQNCLKRVVNERNMFFRNIGRKACSIDRRVRFKLENLGVERFKLFRDRTGFSFSKFCVFVGANACGKSSLLLSIINILRCDRIEYIDMQNFIQMTSRERETENKRFGWKDVWWWQYFHEEKPKPKNGRKPEKVDEDFLFTFNFSKWSQNEKNEDLSFNLKTFIEKESRTGLYENGSSFSETSRNLIEDGCFGNVLYLNSAFVRDCLKVEGIDIVSGGFDELFHSLFGEKELNKMNSYVGIVKQYFQRHFSSIAEVCVTSSESLIMFKKEGENVSFLAMSQGEKMIVLYVLLVCWLAIKDGAFKIVLFDEPDAHLHPPLVKHLYSFLEEFSRDFKAQVICSSHSEIFVSCFDYQDVYHMEKGKQSNSPVQLSSSIEVSNLLSNLGYSHERKIENLYKFSKVLHCRRVVLVEGTSDISFITRWLDLFGENINPVYKVLRTFFDGTVCIKSEIKLPKHAFNVISDWRSVLKSLIEIQAVKPDGSKKKKKKKKPKKMDEWEEILERKSQLQFFLFHDEDVKPKAKVARLKEMFDDVIDEGIYYHRCKMRDIENYILSLCYKLMNSMKEENTQEGEKWKNEWEKKLPTLEKAIVEKHNSHFVPPNCFIKPPSKKEIQKIKEEKREKEKGKGKRKISRKFEDDGTVFKNEGMLNEGKPINDIPDATKLKQWFKDKSILPKLIGETELKQKLIPVSTLENIEAKTILGLVFGKTKYLKSSWKMIVECPMFKKNPDIFIDEDIKKLLKSLRKFYFMEIAFVCSEFDEKTRVCDVQFAHGFLLPSFSDVNEVKFYVDCVNVSFEFQKKKVVVESTPKTWRNINPGMKHLLDDKKLRRICFSESDVVSFLAFFSEFRKESGKLFTVSKECFEKIMKGKVKWLTIKFPTLKKKSVMKRGERGYKSNGKGVDGCFVNFPKEEFDFKINRSMEDFGKILIVTFNVGSFKKINMVRLKGTKNKRGMAGKKVVILKFQADVVEFSEDNLLFSSIEKKEEEKRVRFQIDIFASPGYEYKKWWHRWSKYNPMKKEKLGSDSSFEIQLLFERAVVEPEPVLENGI